MKARKTPVASDVKKKNPEVKKNRPASYFPTIK
jgi:hypothetical protein